MTGRADTLRDRQSASRDTGRPADLLISNLTVEFSSGEYRVRPLDNLSFKASDGELVIVIGPSGCGKTTLLSCLAGLLTPTAGTIRFGDREVQGLQGGEQARYRQATVGVVFQAFNLIPSLTARGNVMVPMRLSKLPAAAARARADELLEQVGMSERAGHRPAQLSGGQQQRVAIARALVHDPPLVIADEPSAHLDYIQVEGILELLRELAAPGRIVVVATHDDRVRMLGDNIIELMPIAEVGKRPPEEVRLAPGAVLFEQGDRGDLVYVVESGRMEIYRVRSDGAEEHVAEIGPGRYFGEMGPMLKLPRSASARALDETMLCAYTLHDFRKRHEGQVSR